MNSPIMEEPIAVESVVFDVGGTLIDPASSVGEIYASVASEHGWTGLDAKRLDGQFHEAWKSKKEFHYRLEDWEEMVIQSFAGVLEPSACSDIFPTLYRRFEDPSNWLVHEDVLPTLDALAGRGFRLGIISNWDQRLKPLLSALRLDGFFEWICISCDVGFEKPSSVIFEHALSRMGLPPNRILYVGDQWDEDVLGARQVGMHSKLIDRGSHGGSDTLKRLTDLEAVVAEAW